MGRRARGQPAAALPQAVWVFDWMLGSVALRIDGAERTPIEEWLAAYLPLVGF